MNIERERFGHLQAAWPVGRQNRKIVWLCICDCGGMTYSIGSNLRNGKSSSCGCIRRQNAALHCSQRNLSHGQSKPPTPEYASWSAAKTRCFNPSAADYAKYGGCGITMCERWKNSFTNFLADMGQRPPGKSLDRYPNPDGNYEPGNCRWASLQEQRHNWRRGAKKAVKVAHSA